MALNEATEHKKSDRIQSRARELKDSTAPNQILEGEVLPPRTRSAATGAEQSLSDQLLSNEQAAERLRLSPQTLRLWRHEGRGPAYHKIGRAVFYHPRDVDAFIASQRRDPKAA